jgi:hypothetical protein
MILNTYFSNLSLLMENYVKLFVFSRVRETLSRRHSKSNSTELSGRMRAETRDLRSRRKVHRHGGRIRVRMFLWLH